MAYEFKNSKGKTYFLHRKQMETKTGKKRDLYYFAGDLRPEFAIDSVPEGKKVVEMASGLPVLKKVE